MRPSPLLVVALALAAGTTLACRHHDDERTHVSVSRPGAYAADTVLGPGDVRIVDEHDGVELALIGDSISGGLSQGTIDKVKRETDTSTVKGSGFGAGLERLIKGTVANALSTRVTIPVADVTDISYEGGAIRIRTRGAKERWFEHTRVNEHNAMESFRPEDAQRFVEAVKARQQRTINR